MIKQDLLLLLSVQIRTSLVKNHTDADLGATENVNDDAEGLVQAGKIGQTNFFIYLVLNVLLTGIENRFNAEPEAVRSINEFNSGDSEFSGTRDSDSITGRNGNNQGIYNF